MSTDSLRPSAVQHWHTLDYIYSVKELDLPANRPVLVELLSSPECRERLNRDGRVLFDVSRSSLAAPQGGDLWTPALEGAA